MDNMKKKILVVLPVNEKQKNSMEEAMPEGEFHYMPVKDLKEEDVSEYSVIIGNVPIPYLAKAERLEWIQLNNAGTEGYTTKGVLKENTILTNATGAYGGIISEHMLGMLLMLQKNLHKYYDNQKEHNWKCEENVTTIEGSTTLILGLGDIGGTFARKMKALGSYTVGFRRRNLEKPDYIDELYSINELDKHIERGDIIALCLPGFEETYHIISKERLKLMKKDAILINVGRGTAIKTDDLVDILEEGHLKGVCLDVTDPEPLPSDHKLWAAENVLITPHISGPFRQKNAMDKIIEISVENLRRYNAGESMINVIDFTTGYCI